MDNKQLIMIRTKLCKNMKLINAFISDVKYNDNTKRKDEFIKYILNRELPGLNYITKGILPKSVEELGSTKFIPFQNDNIINELKWTIFLISRYKKEISIYLKLKNDLQRFIINGQYIEAKKILNEIENSICQSIWGISQLFLLTELDNGIKEHKKLLSQLSEKSKSSVVTFILEFLSFKVEANNTYESLKYKIEKRFPNKKFSFQSELLKEYLLFTLDVKYITTDISKIQKVLAIENTMSIIDIYEAYIKAVQLLLIDENLDIEIRKEVLFGIDYINTILEDSRIDKICTFAYSREISLDEKNYKQFSNILDKYTMGKYIDTVNEIRVNKLLELADFDIYDVFVKSNLFSDSKIEDKEEDIQLLSKKIIELMYLIYNRVDIKKNIQEITNIASMLNEFDISKKIMNFVMQLDKNTSIGFEYLSEFNSRYYTPKSLHIYRKSKVNLLDEFRKKGLFTETIKVFNNIVSDNIDDLRSKFYKANSLINLDINKSIALFEEIYSITNKITGGKKIYYTSKVCEKLYYLYINVNKFDKSLNIIVNTYFMNKDLIYNIKLYELWRAIEDNDEIYCNINIVIFMYLLDNKDYDEQYKALANYIEFNDGLLFSDILSNQEITNKFQKQIYFICDKIYTIEVIKRFAFIEKNERINERINVIRYLIKNNYNKDVLQDELNNLVKEQSIREKIKTVDSSKIVVDNKGILQELHEVYESKFQRFLELKDLKLDIIYVNISKSNVDEDDNIYSILTNTQERQQQSYLLFKELFEEYINELLFNTNYGLDKFLSSRIRHGMLQDYLSKPFTNNNILNTKKDSQSVDYVFNHYVENKIVNLDNEMKKEIINLLADFSMKIMKKIEEVEDWIRIKSEEDVNGLFDYSKIDDNMLNFYASLGVITDYDMFYDKITNIFWDLTEENLKIIREKFDGELYNYFRETLNELEKSLRHINNNYEIINELLTKVGVCSSILKQDLTLVRNWFQIKKDNQYVDFAFQDLISTCIQINNKLNNSYSKISNSVNIDLPFKFRGDKFTYWIDIINILYVNAIKHSGFNNIEEISIGFNANVIDKDEIFRNVDILSNKETIANIENSKNEFMIFSIENRLAENVDEQKIYYKVYDIFENMNTSSYSNYITTEGGTGIYKTANILSNNIKSQYVYKFNCVEKKFKIEIIMELNSNIIVRD